MKLTIKVRSKIKVSGASKNPRKFYSVKKKELLLILLLFSKAIALVIPLYIYAFFISRTINTMHSFIG